MSRSLDGRSLASLVYRGILDYGSPGLLVRKDLAVKTGQIVAFGNQTWNWETGHSYDADARYRLHAMLGSLAYPRQPSPNILLRRSDGAR